MLAIEARFKNEIVYCSQAQAAVAAAGADETAKAEAMIAVEVSF